MQTNTRLRGEDEGKPSRSADHERHRLDPFQYYPRLTRLQIYIKANLSRPISLADAARAVALEKKYFSRYFKICVGRVFSDWLAEQRIEYAIELLRDGDLSISILAFEAGFQDLRTFERKFKRLTGLTPRDFRMRLREEARTNESRQLPETREWPPRLRMR